MFALLAKAAYKVNFVLWVSDGNNLSIMDIDELEKARNILDEVIRKHSEGKQDK